MEVEVEGKGREAAAGFSNSKNGGAVEGVVGLSGRAEGWW
jgi:hypothetical protein